MLEIGTQGVDEAGMKLKGASRNGTVKGLAHIRLVIRPHIFLLHSWASRPLQ